MLKEYSNNFSLIVLASLISHPFIFPLFFQALCLLQMATRWRILTYRNWLLLVLRHMKSFGSQETRGLHGWESKNLRNTENWDLPCSAGPFKFSIVLTRSVQRAKTSSFPPMQIVWHSSWISQQKKGRWEQDTTDTQFQCLDSIAISGSRSVRVILQYYVPARNANRQNHGKGQRSRN